MGRLKTGLSVFCLLVGGMVLAAPQEGAEFDDWRTGCQGQEGEPQVCHIFQNLTMKEDGQRILHIALGYRPGQEQAVVVLTLPLGIALRPGVRLQVDEGETRALPIDVCTEEGCRAAFEIDAEWLGAFEKGEKLKVVFGTLQGKGFSVPVSLKGFDQGLESLKP